MFCQKCGAKNDDNAVQCSACGEFLKKPEAENNVNVIQSDNNIKVEQQAAVNQRPNVPNYLVWAILSTIFCFWPVGIPAIVFAAKVDSKLSIGDYEGALEASKKAKMFCWITFGIGIAIWLITILFIVVVVGAGIAAGAAAGYR